MRYDLNDADRYKGRRKRYEEEIFSLRRYLHRHAQLSGEEHGTSEKVQEELEKRGWSILQKGWTFLQKPSAFSVQTSARTKKLKADG